MELEGTAGVITSGQENVSVHTPYGIGNADRIVSIMGDDWIDGPVESKRQKQTAAQLETRERLRKDEITKAKSFLLWPKLDAGLRESARKFEQKTTQIFDIKGNHPQDLQISRTQPPPASLFVRYDPRSFEFKRSRYTGQVEEHGFLDLQLGSDDQPYLVHQSNSLLTIEEAAAICWSLSSPSSDR